MDRAGENAERFDVDANLMKAIFRLLIELNKVEQRQHGPIDRRHGDSGSDE
jgi:chorismate mutase